MQRFQRAAAQHQAPGQRQVLAQEQPRRARLRLDPPAPAVGAHRGRRRRLAVAL